MNRYLLIAAFLCCSALAALAQSVDLKLNVGGLLTLSPGGTLELGIAPQHSAALSVNYAWNDFGIEEFDYRNTRVIGDYRYYVSPREGADRFFVGGYGKFGNLVITEEETGNQTALNRVAIGLTAGHKWVYGSGFVLDLFGGFGKAFLNGETGNEIFDRAIGAISLFDVREGIGVGWRF